MTDLRQQKILRVANDIPEQTIAIGADSGDVLVVGWGSTYGALAAAVEQLRDEGHAVSLLNLRHLWPLPRNLEKLLRGFKQVLVPELNSGQLVKTTAC